MQTLGLTISAMPLDESVIRTLAPDSYRSLHALRESRKAALAGVASRNGFPGVQAWYVTFFNIQQGDARFDAFDFLVRSLAHSPPTRVESNGAQTASQFAAPTPRPPR